MKFRAFAPAFARAVLALAAVVTCGPGHAFAVTMQCAPYQVMTGAAYPGNGSTGYTAAADGIVTGVGTNDVESLQKAGCAPVTGALTMIGRLIGANMNSTSDQAIPLFVPANQSYQITAIVARNPSASLTTAAGGMYTAPSKGGTAVVASTQVYSAATGATTVENTTLSTGGAAGSWTAGTPLYLSLSTAQGAAATADIYVYGYLGQ